MERHGENAIAVAKMLEAHPMVAEIYYPGKQHTPLSGVLFSVGVCVCVTCRYFYILW